MTTDIQARQILQQFDNNPKRLLGVQAIAKALTNYGVPPGWITPDNNWFSITTAPGPDGQCIQVMDRSTHSVDSGLCAFVYQSPEEGIQHMLDLWFPQTVLTSQAEFVKFVQALDAGDTSTLAQMVLQRTWGLPLRGLRSSDIAAPGIFALDLYKAAQDIAKSLGEQSHLMLPLASIPPLIPMPIPVDVPITPTPGGGTPGGGTPGGGTPGGGTPGGGTPGGGTPGGGTPGGGTPGGGQPETKSGMTAGKFFTGLLLILGAGWVIKKNL